jgi:hypothetical protein
MMIPGRKTMNNNPIHSCKLCGENLVKIKQAPTPSGYKASKDDKERFKDSINQIKM